MHSLSRVSVIAPLLVWGVGACASPASTAQQSAPSSPSSSAVVAEIGDRRITVEELDAVALSVETARFQGMPLRQALYEARRSALNEMLRNELLDREAEARGTTRDALVGELTAGVAEATDEEAAQWYAQNSQRVGGAPLSEVASAIKGLLTEVRRRGAVDQLVAELREKTPLRISLEPPRLGVEVTANDPSRGPEDAPIHIVEFSDFQCPFCASAVPTIKRVLATYGDRVRLSFRNFPLASHSEAFKAAEAGQCAADQGKFWEFHDLVFERRAAGMKPDQLKQYASELGLDTGVFTECLDGAKHEAEVRNDLEAGQNYGVSATPTFYINGRVMTGAQPFEEFSRVIEEELASQAP